MRETGRRRFALASRVFRGIRRTDVVGQGAKIAYYAFLAMPPALMALFGAAGLIGSADFAGWLEAKAALALPPPVTTGIIEPFIRDVLLEEAPGPFSVGLILALWGGSSVFSGLMDSLNLAYGVAESRSWVRKRTIALGTMIAGVALFLLAAVSLLAGPALSDAAGLGGLGSSIWSVLQWPLAFAFMVAAFWVGYYVLPNRDQAGCRLVLLRAAASAAAVWVLATAAFRVYIANFSTYSETYGFIGAFIILLLWLYMTAVVVLAGGVLASQLESGSDG